MGQSDLSLGRTGIGGGYTVAFIARRERGDSGLDKSSRWSIRLLAASQSDGASER